jgi:hypothetical protein
VGTCKIMYEKILATIQKSGLYSFIRMAFSQPLFRKSTWDCRCSQLTFPPQQKN